MVESRGAAFLELVAVQDRLRSPGGCPWDREQTHESLVRHLVEEAYECVEAIETGDRRHLREELGDLLMQIVFHARIAEEDPAAPWTIDDVAADITAKLIRRHPHVFADADANADADVTTAADVEANWERIKAAEKQRSSVVDGVPLAQPALALADALLRRADRAGAPEALLPDGDDIGARLMKVVAEARAGGVDPEAALRAAARGYRDRVADWETRRA